MVMFRQRFSLCPVHVLVMFCWIHFVSVPSMFCLLSMAPVIYWGIHFGYALAMFHPYSLYDLFTIISMFRLRFRLCFVGHVVAMIHSICGASTMICL